MALVTDEALEHFRRQAKRDAQPCRDRNAELTRILRAFKRRSASQG